MYKFASLIAIVSLSQAISIKNLTESNIQNYPNEAQLRRDFDNLDKNRDRVLQRSELERALR